MMVHGEGPALEVRGLSKRFGSVTALSDVSFAVPYGAVTGFIGGNGSGKTTTIRTLLGLTVPTAGEAYVAGRPIAEHLEPHLVVGASLDRIGAHPGLSGRRHLALLATAAHLPSERTDEVLELVGLEGAADRKVKTYSTGMRQRLALAAALLSDAQILVLDEPSTGLDPLGIRWLRELLRTRADDGCAVFVSTHHVADLETVVDSLVALDHGMLVAAGPVDKVLRDARVDSLEELLFAARVE